MLLREILAMSKEKPIRSIAKDHLEIGEKKLTETLKKIGATNQRGRRGWDFHGNADILELSIYDLVEDKRKARAKTNEQINEITKSQAKEITESQAKKVTKKRASFDLDVEILKKIKHHAIENDEKISQVVESILYSFFDQNYKER